MLLLCCLGCGAMAQQGKVAGRVIDGEGGGPLSFATVALLRADSTVLAGAMTDDSGRYAFANVPYGEYVLSISFIGCQPMRQPLDVESPSVEVPTATLMPDAAVLEAVRVVDKVPVVEQKVDKLVLNVANSAFAQGNNAFDLLRKAPGVTIDKDGNVLLNGQAVAVWIDGRPSNLDGKSLEALLRSTDGATIDKIEVMANPSAKYDAAGQGGIINIKTKRTLMQGFNGTLSADGGGMGFRRRLEFADTSLDCFLNQNVSLNLNYRSAKTNSFLQVSEGTGQMGVDYTTRTVGAAAENQFLQRSGALYNVRYRSLNLKVGNDWFINKRNTLGFIFTMPMNAMSQDADTNADWSYRTVGQTLVEQIRTRAATAYDMRQYMGNVNYSHVFNEATASELTVNLDYLRHTTNSENEMQNYFLPLAAPLLKPGTKAERLEALSLQSDNVVNVYSAKADWQGLVGGRVMMEAGAKWAFSLTDNLLTSTMGETVLGTGLVNGLTVESPFDYAEHVGALYASGAAQLSPNWSVKAGLRGEYTNAHNSTNVVRQNYFSLFPTLFAGWNSSDMSKRVNLSYTRRIKRPTYSELNPFQNYIDAHTSNMGNPDLRPCFSNNIALSAGFGRYVTLFANGIFMKDDITVVPKLDPATGDQILFRDNFGSNTLLGGGATLSELPLGKLFTLMLNVSAYNYRSSAPRTASLVAGVPDSDEPYRSNSLYASGYACLTLLLPKAWKVQLDGWCSSPVTAGYLKVGWNYAFNLGVKKNALDNRLTFSLNVNDIFRTMNNSFETVSSAMTMSCNQRYLTQTVKVGLQWNFGTAQKPLRQRKVGSLEEAGRIGGGGLTDGVSNGK